MHLRQVALVVADLEDVAAALRAGLGIEVAYRDPGVSVFGLRNAVLPVGEDFLELLTPIQEGTAAGRWRDRRGGDCGYMVIVEVGDLDAARQRAEDAGVRVAWEGSTGGWSGIHLHPRDTGGTLLSFDTAPPGDWPPAGPDWRDHVRTHRVTGLAGATICTPNPDETAALWSALFATPARERRLELDGATLSFAHGTGQAEGLTDVALRSSEQGSGGSHLDLAGVRFHL